MPVQKRLLDIIAPTNNEINSLKDVYKGLVIAVMSGEIYRDIAFNFNIPIGTVKSRLNRARTAILNSRLVVNG